MKKNSATLACTVSHRVPLGCQLNEMKSPLSHTGTYTDNSLINAWRIHCNTITGAGFTFISCILILSLHNYPSAPAILKAVRSKRISNLIQLSSRRKLPHISQGEEPFGLTFCLCLTRFALTSSSQAAGKALSGNRCTQTRWKSPNTLMPPGARRRVDGTPRRRLLLGIQPPTTHRAVVHIARGRGTATTTTTSRRRRRWRR